MVTYNKIKKNMKTNRYENYKGFNNQEITNLYQLRDGLTKQIRDIDEKIRYIRNNCDHDFLFYCSCGYEDEFMCCKCGECITI